MRIAIINSVCGSGSTGRICEAIASKAMAEGHNAMVFYGLGTTEYDKAIKISNRADYLSHNILSRISDGEGLFSSHRTRRLLRKLEDFNPDIVHIHNLHGHYVNYQLLFDYIGEHPDLQVVMTLHDCWSFTGHCAHFEILNCDRWLYGCDRCMHKGSYPSSYISRSSRNFNLKKILISSLGPRLHLIPVSYWMDSFLPKSMYSGIDHTVIHNGIDLSVFRYTEKREILNTFGISGQYVLGVALPWSSYKGLMDMVKLRESLPETIQIVLVGLSKEQLASMPEGIIGIPPISHLPELAALYSSALALVNTTYCDNYPTVNLESIACGTPVITYNTGGSPESVVPQTGAIVPKGDIQGLVDAVHALDNCNRDELRTNCIRYAQAHFSQEDCFMSYVDLYSQL